MKKHETQIAVRERERERESYSLNRRKNGITLIALVVTIVILIILSVISINAVFGEDGLIANAERAGIEHTHATVWEAMEMEYSNYWIDKTMVGGNLITYLQEEDKDIIGKELKGAGYVINTEKLLGTRMPIGNGTDGTNDVYKLEPLSVGETNIAKVASTEKNIKLAEKIIKSESRYQVKYYGPSGDRVLGILGDNISSLIESDNPNFEIEKKATSTPPNGKEYYTVGDTIEYTIIATNTGDVTIKDIQITDTLTAGSGTYKPGDEHLVLSAGNSEKIGAKDGYWTISSLDSQKTETIIYTYTVQQKDIEEGKIVNNVITELKGEPQPTVPKGHIIPEVEVPTVPEEPQVKRTIHIEKVDEKGKLLPGAVIEIYKDRSCSPESFCKTIDLKETGSYDWTEDIPQAGIYYIKESVIPAGYNPIEILEMEITDEPYQEWTIINFAGMELPESSGGVLELWTDSKIWKVGITSLFAEDVANFGQPTTLHIYRLGSVDDSGSITYSDSISDISDLPTEFSEVEGNWFELGKSSYGYQKEFLNYLCGEMAVESVNDLGLESYLDINLENYKKINMSNNIYAEEELRGKTDLFVVSCDNIVTKEFEYSFAPMIIEVEKGNINLYLLLTGRETRKGRVEIETEVLNYDYNLGYPSNIIYKVEAMSEGNLVYSDVITQFVTYPGNKTVMLDNIPSGTTVTVSQIYSGASSKCTSQKIQQPSWDYFSEEEPTCKVSFTNQYEASSKLGYGILNRFYYWDKRWDLDKITGEEEIEEGSLDDKDIAMIAMDEEFLNVMIEEEFSSWIKTIAITNSADSEEDCYIRARAFSGFDDRLQYDYDGESWEKKDDGWWYYNQPIQPGAASTVLSIDLNELANEYKRGIEFEEGSQFNVAVVFEAIPINGSW